MRNRSAWILAATMIVAGLFATASLPYLWKQVRRHVPALACPAYAQETMKFEPVPAESVTASERRRAERLAAEATRRSVESAPPAPDHPDVPVPPEPPVAPDFSHAGDVVRIGSDIHIEKGQEVEGDVFALRGDIRVDGHVKGNVAATGGNVFLGSSARIDGDVMCIGGKLEEEDGARVGGQRVTALRGNGSPGLRRMIRKQLEDDLEPMRHFRKVSFALSWLLVSVALAWAIAKFAPNRTAGALVSLKREPGLNLMLGLGGVLMLVPSVVALALVVAILCITIIGIPLALGVLVAYAGLLVVLAFWGHAIGVIPIGERVVQRLGRPGTLVSGAVFGALTVAGIRLASEMFHFIPLFGWFANLLWVVAFLVGTTATLMGAGALIRTKFGQGPEGRWWPLFPRTVTPSSPAAGMPPVTPPAPPPPAPPPGPMGSPGDPTPVA